MKEGLGEIKVYESPITFLYIRSERKRRFI